MSDAHVCLVCQIIQVPHASPEQIAITSIAVSQKELMTTEKLQKHLCERHKGQLVIEFARIANFFSQVER